MQNEQSDFILGVDEAGTGSFAGPFLVCAALVPKDWSISGLNDSKKLTPKKREALFKEISALAPFVRVFVEWCTVAEIFEKGLGRRHRAAQYTVVRSGLAVQPSARVIVDGTNELQGIEHDAIPKADSLFPAVMAASIFAKVLRDRWMTEKARQFPFHGFEVHKGYGTPGHIQAIKEHGLTELHRRGFAPIARLVAASE